MRTSYARLVSKERGAVHKISEVHTPFGNRRTDIAEGSVPRVVSVEAGRPQGDWFQDRRSVAAARWRRVYSPCPRDTKDQWRSQTRSLKRYLVWSYSYAPV